MKSNILLLALLGLFFSCKKDTTNPTPNMYRMSTSLDVGIGDSNVTQYFYHANGDLRQSIYKGYDASNTTEFKTYGYLGNGKLANYTYIRVLTHRADTVYHDRYTFNYDASGELTKVDIVDRYGVNVDSVFHDPNKKWFKRKYYFYVKHEQKWMFLFEDSCEIDKDKDVTKVFKRWAEGKAYFLLKKYDYLDKTKPYKPLPQLPLSYWESKKLVKEETQFRDEGDLFTQISYNYTFDNLGHPISARKDVHIAGFNYTNQVSYNYSWF